MFIVGGTNTVYRYGLSTAFDLSTASYDSVSFSVSSQLSGAKGLAFNNNGTKMYIVGNTTDDVYQYSTGTVFVPTSAYHPTVTKATGQIDTGFWTDINTMTADETLNGGEVYYAVSTDDRTTWAVIDDEEGVRNIVRDNAGTWQYNDATTYSGTTWVNATTNDELYALQEALENGNAEEVVGFQLSSASYDSVSFSVASEDVTPTGITFNNDGTKMYVLGESGDEVNQYSLSTAFDLSTASFDSVTFSVASQEIGPKGIAFNNDGTKMYITGNSGDDVNQYTLSTAFDLSTASYDSVTFSVSSEDTRPNGILFNSDGTKMYILGREQDRVFQYSLGTAFDLSTASYDSVSFSFVSEEDSPRDFSFNSDGTKMFILGTTGVDVSQYSLSTAYDISTASFDSVTFSVSSQESAPEGLAFNNDGSKMYVVGPTTDTVYQYTTGSTGNYNRMNSTQLNAVTDPNHYTLGDTLDLAIMLYTASASSIPESDGVSINYDAEALNQGAVLGTDYDFDFPDSTTVRVTSNAAQNLKIRVV
jgi:6-phosphogluconolactonase (cycloisomerase 2 family)